MEGDDERAFDDLPEGEAVESEGSSARKGIEEQRRIAPLGRRESDKEREWLYKLVLGCTAICVLCTLVCMIVSFTVLRNRADIVETQDVVQAVQQERVVVTVKNCEAQNERHDETIKKLDARLDRLPLLQRARAQESRDFTVDLIDQLQPKVPDCKAVADKNVQAGGG